MKAVFFTILLLNTHLALAKPSSIKDLVTKIGSAARISPNLNQVRIYPGFVEENPSEDCSLVIINKSEPSEGYRSFGVVLFPTNSPKIELDDGISYSYSGSMQYRAIYTDMTLSLKDDSSLVESEFSVLKNVEITDKQTRFSIQEFDYDQSEKRYTVADTEITLEIENETFRKVKGIDLMTGEGYTCIFTEALMM